MKPASTALRTLLDSGQFYKATCYTISLLGGVTLRYNTGDRNITVAGAVYSAVGPAIECDGLAQRRGISVDNADLRFVVRPDVLISGVPFFSAIRLGHFDGAEIMIEEAFMPTWGDVSAGTVLKFLGRVADVEAAGVEAFITVASHTELLNQDMPRNLYLPGCVHTLFDAGCTLSKAAFTVSRTVLAGATTQLVPITDAAAAGHYDLGGFTVTSGALTGYKRSVKQWAGPNLKLLTPLPTALAAGVTIDLFPGCDKLQSTCDVKFSNKANFRGFRFVPLAETAI